MKYRFTVIFLFFSVVSSQETVTISGFIREEATGEPLGYTNVFVKETNIGTASNIDGYYVLIGVPSSGTQEIIASIIGYEMMTQSINIQSNRELRLDFRLKRTVLEGETVDVFGEAQKMRQLVEPSRTSLDMRTIETAPAFIEPDLFRTVQMLPGVQTLNDFSSALYVRGSTPDQNLIMLDGITVYNPYHLGGIFSTFNTDAIKEADFHAGGFPARYGGRMGAILSVINREGNTEEFKGNANISLVSSKVLLEGPIPKIAGVKGSWMLAGRRTYFDQIVNAILRSNGEDDFKFPYFFYDYQMKINLDLNRNHRITYSRFYGDDVLTLKTSGKEENYDIYSDYYEKTSSSFEIDWPWGNHTNSLKWRWLISPQLVANTFLASSRYRFHFNMGQTEEGSWRSMDEEGTFKDQFIFDFFDIVDDRTVETEFSWHGIPDHQLMAGVQLKKVNYDLGMKFKVASLDTTISLRPLEMKEETQETSLYIQDKWDINPVLAVQLGGRFMDYSLHDKIYFDPRFSLKYLLRQDLALKFALGRYHQFLTIANSEDETLRIIDFWLGIPADKPATWADHAILGLEFLSENNWIFRVETYYKHFENLITLKQGQLFSPGEEDGQIRFTPFNDFYETKGYAYGLEFLLKKTTGRLRGWIGYTYAETKRHTIKHGWYYPKYDRTHTINIVGDVELFKKGTGFLASKLKDIHFSTAIQASSGQPYTPPLGRYEQWSSNNDALVSTWYDPYEAIIVGAKNSSRLPAYFRLDVGLKQKKKFFNLPYERYIQLVNVTNHVNPLTYNYRAKINKLTNETLGIQRAPLPMFPFFLTLGYRIEF